MLFRSGRSFFIATIAELEAVYEAIEEELRSRFLITYQSTNDSPDDAFRTVEVLVDRPGVEANGPGVWLEVDREGPQALPGGANGKDPDVSPDGKRIVFVRNRLHQSWVSVGTFTDDDVIAQPALDFEGTVAALVTRMLSGQTSPKSPIRFWRSKASPYVAFLSSWFAFDGNQVIQPVRFDLFGGRRWQKI